MIRQKGGLRTGQVSYQHKRRPRSTVLVSKIRLSPEQLKAAVRKIRSSAKAVEEELKAGVAP
jgi:hypothetical protein